MPHRSTPAPAPRHHAPAATPAPTAAPAADTSAEAVMRATAATSGRKKTVIHAEKGQPLPNPPHGGTWSRDPDTGDLTLVEAPTDAAPVRASSEPPVVEQPKE